MSIIIFLKFNNHLTKKYSQKYSLQLSCPRKRILRLTWTAFKSFQQIGTQICILQEEAIAIAAQALGLRWNKAASFLAHYSASLYMGSPPDKDAH